MLKRISFFQKNLLLSSIFTLLIGITLIASSYYIEGKVINETLESQGVGLGELLASELDSEQILKTIPVLDPAAPEQVPMIAFLDRISAKNTNVAQAYVFKKDRQENGLFTAISVPSSLIEVGATPGVEMPDAPPFVEAYDKAMASKKAAASTTYTDEYGTWFTVITPILDKNGEITAFFGVDMSASIIKNSQISMVKSLAIALIVLFLILFAVQYVNLKRIMKPINDLSKAVNEVSAGNLEVELKVTSHDEIGTVAMGFNGMVKKIRDNMQELEAATHQILHTFAQVASVSDNTNEQASNILASLEEITQTTDYLAGEAERGNHQLIDMNSKIEIILTHTSEAATSITGCLHQSDEGIDIIEALKDKFSETEVITLQVGQKIYGLESRMRRINDLLNSIQDVAEQTGLLSLNASIEAARAGEHGRGFSVVAEEIRKLSTNSKQASEEIASLLKMISQDVDSTGQEMRVAETSLNEQSKHVEKTISSFYQIRDHIQAVVNSIQKVDQTIQIVEQNKETLLETVESVSSMAEETAASVELIQRNFSEQVGSIQELNESCHQMKNAQVAQK